MRRLRRAYDVARLFNMEPKKSSCYKWTGRVLSAHASHSQQEVHRRCPFTWPRVQPPHDGRAIRLSSARAHTRRLLWVGNWSDQARLVSVARGVPVFCWLFWGLGVPVGCSRGGFRKSSCERVGPDNIHRPVGGLRRAAAAGWAKPAL